MPPVFGPVSLSPMRLKSCAGPSAPRVAVAQRQQRELLALKELLHEHARARFAEAAVEEEVPQRRRASRGRLGDDHALSGREAVGLQHAG